MTEHEWDKERNLVIFRLQNCERTIKQIDTNVQDIQRTLARMEGANRIKTISLNLGVPALVAFAVVMLDHLMR